MEANGLSGMGISGIQSASLSRCELHTAVCDIVTKWLDGQYELDRGAACTMLLHTQHPVQCDDESPGLLQGLVGLIICALHFLSIPPLVLQAQVLVFSVSQQDCSTLCHAPTLT